MFGLTDKTMNNREIKFRIWDKQNKKWLENSSSLHCYSNWTICPFTGNVVDYVKTCDENGENFSASPANDYYWEDGKLIKEPRYITQQYTGLKDSKGVEIYEGDILKWHEGENNFSEVIFQNGSFMVCGINWGAFWYLSDYCDAYTCFGNVFENKELLNL
jgi:uncharacterized phage protein (TIGR01671 family)